MARLIEADKLRHALFEFGKGKQTGEIDHGLLLDIIEMVDEQPAVDAVPVIHSRWIKHSKHNGIYFCSRCHEISLSNGHYPFCPNCGAKMDGERRDEDADRQR